MIGPKTLGKRMKFDKKEDFYRVKKYSLIKMSSDFSDEPKDYILVSSSKKHSSIDVVCVDPYYFEEETPPSFVLSYPADSIDYIEVLPKDDLLFLIAHTDNPHICAAIKGAL